MSIKIFKKHFPLKKYGQNFLINKNIVDNIIKKIHPEIGQTLVEIGPGLAALTEPMCQLLDQLFVIEVDYNLLLLLKQKSFYSKLVVFCQDALTFNFTQLFYKKNQLIRIFGNLPYNISTSLILFLFKHIQVIQDMNFMLQKEVAERLIALPGNKSYGRLSIISQYYCDIKILLNAIPEDFYPIPKVHSIFVKLIPHNISPYFVYDINILSLVTNKSFQNRRKILRHSLKDLFSETILVQLDINPKLRAENVSILQYCQLANYLYKKNLKK
ncbi:16S rRNA (adenine(1518)-N(6)/adenine(1519)-N(6))-dimethyltransferase RsmA [Buchnera aphidicola (Brachycaudus cardui)]|uniref:Ribosomal RNA small subunit methyltransferase A n=1 Tax=Buchnera aphidicola (Brachycaudus cardui) TaxID=557993 RepID=A0A4D6Y118_9GAMM|nr:16S rRNA (adenine(1518)-N(6)/adenine(1519)-N(6))-dimethyltransferase RsmA [Buchnera aphidicola]QCI20294.1 16S rRNA (adenine(1518)-N(6)/adenine(1519)-N(6))-dimethyltransferase RsmA [Buchnera aphidicola (Brachycaudus cardui)]